MILYEPTRSCLIMERSPFEVGVKEHKIWKQGIASRWREVEEEQQQERMPNH